MQIDSSSFEEPAELNANNPVERLLLSTQSGQRELQFFPESNNGHYWRVVEVMSSENGRERVVRFLDLEKHAVLPLGVVQAGTQDVWNVVIVYEKGERNYQLRNSDEAYKLQRLITGYRHCDSFKSVTCHVIFKSKKLLSMRDEEDRGAGEIQLWEWPTFSTRTSRLGIHTQTSLSPARGHAASIASTVQTVSGTDGGTSLQTTGGRELLLSSIPPPPVLVFYTQDRDFYKMMKADVTNLEYRHLESRVDLFKSSRQPFRLERLAVKDLKHWNLCAMRPTIKSNTEKLKCTYISLQFQSPELAGRFLDSLLDRQLLHIEREGGRVGVHGPLYNGTLPPSVQARSPTSLGGNMASSSSFVSLPHIPHTEPIGDSLFRARSEPQSRRVSVAQPRIPELTTERGIAEVGGVQIGNMSELPGQVDVRNPNRGQLNWRTTGYWR